MIREYLKEHILITDGAMGTYYDRKKSENGRIAEEANLLEPELITRIHEEYLEQGARLIRTNTFAANHAMALGRGVRDRREQDAYVKHVIRAAWKLAQKAAENRPEEIFVAADIGPAAENLFSEYETDPAAEYRFLADCFLECGAQIFNFETFSDIKYVAKTARYIKEKCPEAFVMVSFAANRNGYTTQGISISRLFAEAAQTPEIDSYGCNCLLGAAHMYKLIKAQNLAGDKFIQVLPNSGYQQIVRGQAGHADGVHYFADKMEQMAELGVNIIGGCCGTTPKHIRMLCEKLAGKAPYEKLPVVEKGGEDAVSQTRNNSFMAKLQQGEKVIAVELDPPFNQDAQKLMEGAFQLKQSGVDIITIADSPLARARADSVLLAAKVGAMVDIPVMPLPTLEVLAYGAVLSDGQIVPIMDARRGQVYAALYRREDGTLRCVEEAAVLTVEDLAQRLGRQEGPCILVGDGVPAYGERLREMLGSRVEVAPPHLRYLRAGAAAALALAHCREGVLPVHGDDIALAYLRKPQAEREREARLRREAFQ